MKINRRKTKGTPLLIATAGVGLTVTACIGKGVTSGNLMAPPMVELCIEVEPETAEVQVDGIAVVDGDCSQVYEGIVTIEATADGYQDYSEDVEVYETTTHSIEMTPEVVEDSGE